MIVSRGTGHVWSRRRKRLRGALGRAFLLAVVATGMGCGKGTPPSQAPSLAQPASPPAARVASPPPEESQAPVVYQSRGRRDPFSPPRADLAREEPVVHLQVTGIVWGPRGYYAVVEAASSVPIDPPSRDSPDVGYVVREGDVVDSAKVLKITKERVIFEVRTKSADGKPSSRYVAKHIRSGDK